MNNIRFILLSICSLSLIFLPGLQASVTVTTIYSYPSNSVAHGLTQGTDGNLYGATDTEFYRLSLGGAYTTLHTFGATTIEGDGPHRVIQATDGNFYGTMSAGGSSEINGYTGDGTIFRITPSGSLTVIHNFNLSDGSDPEVGLVQASDGALYGTTYFGGKNSDGSTRTGGVSGTAFKITLNGGFTSLHTFMGYSSDGANPEAPLVDGGDGVLYGTTYTGGINRAYGTVFSLTSGGAESIVTDFSSLYGPVGSFADPAGPLLVGQNGLLYGSTLYGGLNGNGSGTIFSVSTGGALSIVHGFTGSDGQNPSSSMVQMADGTFYGTTPNGGSYNAGTIFKIATNGAFTTEYTFTGGSDGGNPEGLILATDGNMYVPTVSGGNYGLGTVTRVNLASTSSDPFGGLLLGGGYYYSSWFGIYNTQFYPWIYRTDLGFIYVDAVGTDLYLYVNNGSGSGSMGWIYTTQTLFPNVYSFTHHSWLYYYSGGTSFYNYSTSSFENY